MFLRLLEVLIYLLGFVIIVTQIVMPGMQNKSFFPIFSKTASLEKDLANVHSLEEQHKMQLQLDKKLSKLEKDGN